MCTERTLLLLRALAMSCTSSSRKIQAALTYDMVRSAFGMCFKYHAIQYVITVTTLHRHVAWFNSLLSLAMTWNFMCCPVISGRHMRPRFQPPHTKQHITSSGVMPFLCENNFGRPSPIRCYVAFSKSCSDVCQSKHTCPVLFM